MKTSTMYIAAILVFVLATALLFGANYLFYRILIRFFDITSSNIKISLLVFSVLLAVSFSAAAILTRFWESNFTRIFYIFSNAWLGLLLNLLMASFIVWLIAKLLKFPEPGLAVKIFSVSLFFLAIAFSAYGIWNAFSPRIKFIDVKIPNLPPQWQGKTIVQLSDVHLGVVNQADFMEQVVEKTNAINPELVLITGDLFDGMDGNLSLLIKPLDNLKAQKGIYFVTGNHEIYLGLNNVLAALQKTSVKYLDNQIVDIDGLQLIGLGYSSFAGRTDIQKIIEAQPNFSKNRPAVLMYHTPTNTKQAEAAGVNLQLSGHAHRGQLFPIGLFELLIYGKYYYGFYQNGDYSFYASAGVGTWGPPLRTSGSPEIVAIKLK